MIRFDTGVKNFKIFVNLILFFSVLAPLGGRLLSWYLSMVFFHRFFYQSKPLSVFWHHFRVVFGVLFWSISQIYMSIKTQSTVLEDFCSLNCKIWNRFLSIINLSACHAVSKLAIESGINRTSQPASQPDLWLCFNRHLNVRNWPKLTDLGP